MPHIRTKLAHAGCRTDAETGAVVAPIHTATTYERDADGSYSRGFFYSRADNPTRRLFEETLADLDGGGMALAFSSGMAAASALLQTLEPGDHVVLPDDLYHGVRHLALKLFAPRGIRFTSVDMTDVNTIGGAMTERTRFVWIETPSNPLLKITDIEAAAAIAHGGGASVVVDATWSTPLLLQPLQLGADVVMHSATKYLGGHSDVLLGALVLRRGFEGADVLREVQTIGGAVGDPFGCWLTLRGMRSLGARMRVHCENAARLAEFLAAHPKIEHVHYPGFAQHPGHRIARRQMKDFGGMLSAQVRGGEEAAMKVAANVEVFRRATSLGGTESLIEHRASIEAQPTQTPVNLLRISVGLEHIDDLLNDIGAALEKL